MKWRSRHTDRQTDKQHQDTLLSAPSRPMAVDEKETGEWKGFAEISLISTH